MKGKVVRASSVLVLSTLLTGCAQYAGDLGTLRASGGAGYHYKNTIGDKTCEVVVTSDRDFPQGVDVKIDKDCAVVVETSQVSSSVLQREALGVVDRAISRLPVLGASP